MERKSPLKAFLIQIPLLFVVLLFFIPAVLCAQYPEIKSLDNSDPLFRQLTGGVKTFYRAVATSSDIPHPVFYRYSLKGDEDIYFVAARTNIGIPAIASINGLAHPEELHNKKEIILPSFPGIYVAKASTNDLQRMMQAIRSEYLTEDNKIEVHINAWKTYFFFPDDKFTSLELAFFLNILFRFPLVEGYLSSKYGARVHPISGQEDFHSGIDIAAPKGTGVLAARSGLVVSTGIDPDLGNYIVLEHGGGYSTIYGHLDTIYVNLKQEVNSGSLIGGVGSTGISTGPHLHFEVRQSGNLRDPELLLYGN
jgi:murein DD-endopeptidase MepM/ murein hydrolase activator NlpD